MAEAVKLKSGMELALPALFLGALGIAFAPIFVRLSEAGPVASAFYRILLALPILMVWNRFEGKREGKHDRPNGWADYAKLSVAGLFFAGDLAVWHWSIVKTSVANATLLANFAPVFVTLAGYFLFKERFSRTFLLGMVLAITGACLLMGDSLVFRPERVVGDILGVITAVFYAGYLIAVGKLRSRFSTITIMTWSSVATAVVLLPVTVLTGESLVVESVYGWSILLGLALVSHIGGQGMIAYALAHLPTAFSSVGLLLQPAVAAGLAWILFAEAMGVMQAVGGAVILVGIFLAKRGS